MRCNVFAGIKCTCFYAAIWYLMFQWKGFGISGLLKPRNIYNFCRLWVLSLQAAIGELVYKFKTRNLSVNTEIEQMREEFKTYQYKPQLQPWLNLESSSSTSTEVEPEKTMAKVG